MSAGVQRVGIWVVLSLACIYAGGCAATPRKSPSAAAAAQAVPAQGAPGLFATPRATEGSLWTEAGDLLFVDSKARRIGDTVTVDIVENTSSSMDANTSTSRSSSIDANVAYAFGLMRWLEEQNKYINRDQDGSLTNNLLKANLENQFDGEGSSDRSGRVTASIGARVAEVLPNGNLFIVGRREMKVNNEVQFITVSGVVRPKDISSENRVKSTFLADARVAYYGKGVLADKQKPGWMTRIIDHVWPF